MQTVVRQVKLGAFCRVKVPVGQDWPLTRTECCVRLGQTTGSEAWLFRYTTREKINMTLLHQLRTGEPVIEANNETLPPMDKRGSRRRIRSAF